MAFCNIVKWSLQSQDSLGISLSSKNPLKSLYPMKLYHFSSQHSWPFLEDHSVTTLKLICGLTRLTLFQQFSSNFHTYMGLESFLQNNKCQIAEGFGKFTELTKGRYTRTANSNVGKVYICRLVCWEACLDALL